MKRKTMIKNLVTLLCVTAIAAFIFTGCGSSSDSSGQAKETIETECSNGIMVGQVENDVASYKGVPYAEPPVGDLRWKAPVAAEDSDEKIECLEYGDTAIQYEWPTEQASYSEKSEDCLTLNIWVANDDSTEKKAVMFWIHGGGYSWGGTTDPIYDGQNFVEENPDVILVTANYRLGIMSWADFSQIPGGEDYTDLNLGIRDNICALEWVQKNIEAFGGDPENVTIFGESAGGSSVKTLVGSPAAKGLFNKAIIESGSEDNVGTVEDARAFAETMMETAGCSNMEEMLEISGEEWMELDSENWLGDESPGAVLDGEIITDDYDDALINNASGCEYLMVGCTADEQNYFVEEADADDRETKEKQWKESLDTTWTDTYESVGSEGQKLMDEYLEIQTSEGKEDFLAKSSFVTESERYNVTRVAKDFTESGNTAFTYFWNVPSTDEKYYKSACHAVELAYVFNNLQDTIYTGEDPDEDTAKRTQEAWTNFAKTGDPSIDGTEWTAYDPDKDNIMQINLDGWKMEDNPLGEQRSIYKSLFEDYMN